MKNKFISFSTRFLAAMLAIVMAVTIFPQEFTQTAQASSPSMNLYGIDLETSSKGDCALMESNGQYLLMDIGQADHAPYIVQQLQALGVNKISIYFSHLHKDHIGGATGNMLEGLQYIVDAGIQIETLYLPDPSLAPLSKAYPEKYEKLKTFMEGKGNIVYLKVGSTLSVGNVTGSVIGPTNVNDIKPSDYAEYSKNTDGDDLSTAAYTYYENNLSLVTIFKCGNIKYFTAGDCLADEAAALVSKYSKETLDCDIMKLCHHGTGGGNTATLIEAVSPTYSFASNTSYVGVSPSTGKWYTYKALTRAARYGMPYMIASQHSTIIYHVEDNKVTMYEGTTIAGATAMSGWQTIIGGDGANMKKASYYIESNGSFATGLQLIDGQYYNFGTSGTMVYGNFVKGKYAGWKTDTDGRRYYYMNSSKTKAYLAMGFKTIDGLKYYFKEDGYLLKGDDSITEIEGKQYFLNSEGIILTSDVFEDNDGNTYYCNSEGEIVKHSGMATTKEGDKYFLDDNGLVIKPSDGSEVEQIEYKGATYTIESDGRILMNCKRTIGGETFYFGSDGQTVTSKLVSISGKKYYFGANGYMVTNQKVRIKGKAYYFGEDGAMYVKKHVRINDVLYYCRSNGTMKKINEEKTEDTADQTTDTTDAAETIDSVDTAA